MNDLYPLLETVKKLKGRGLKVVVLGPIIEYSQSLPRILAQQNAKEKLLNTRNYNEIAKVDSKFSSTLESENIVYYSVLQAMCSNERNCLTLQSGMPIQFDYGHLTSEGAKLVLTTTELFQSIRP